MDDGGLFLVVLMVFVVVMVTYYQHGMSSGGVACDEAGNPHKWVREEYKVGEETRWVLKCEKCNRIPG